VNHASESLVALDTVVVADAPGSSNEQISKRTGIEPRLLRRILERLSQHTVRALLPIVRDFQGRILAPLSEAERVMLRDLMIRVITSNS
jgi:hypothetical protein